MRTLRVAALVFAAAALGTACGGGGSSNPASPTPTPVIAQVAGVWTGVNESMSVAGGECVGVTLTSMVDVDTAFNLDVTQSGASLTAVSTAPISGLSTDYSGTAGPGSMSLSAGPSVAWVHRFSCLNGLQRDVQAVTDTINVTVSDDKGSATTARTYNVFVAGTTAGVGTMTVTSTFSVAR